MNGFIAAVATSTTRSKHRPDPRWLTRQRAARAQPAPTQTRAQIATAFAVASPPAEPDYANWLA